MTGRVCVKIVIGALAVLVWGAAPAQAQEVVTGPPPELRKNLDAFLKAVNATPEAYETMAKETFSPAFYKGQTAAERRKVFEALREQYGTLTFGRVERNGPEEPLIITVKGSKAEGTVYIDLDDTHRVAGLRTS